MPACVRAGMPVGIRRNARACRGMADGAAARAMPGSWAAAYGMTILADGPKRPAGVAACEG
jgi:hypothetical protein